MRISLSGIPTILIVLLIESSCKKKEDIPETISNAVTGDVSNITFKSAKGRGNIISDGNSILVCIGLCWSKYPDLTIEDSVAFAWDTDNYTCNISAP